MFRALTFPLLGLTKILANKKKQKIAKKKKEC
jgi:hypothetical protein